LTLRRLNGKLVSDTEAPRTFFEEMDGVDPIEQDKIISQADQTISSRSIRYRKKSALTKVNEFENFLTDGEVRPVEPNQILSFKIDGIQPNVFKNLKRGKYEFDYHLDLHRMTVEQARRKVFDLVSRVEIDELRCFRITHGKGERSKQPARLKSYVHHWLKQIKQVVAFHTALPNHGGVGSVYVLLKKASSNPNEGGISARD